MPQYLNLEATIGNTPLARLQRLPGVANDRRGNVILGKMEGNNPAGSVKDRAALTMIDGAQQRGDIRPGDTLIEATSGNTGIALAMVAAMRGYKMVLIMPDNLSIERRQALTAYGAELILVTREQGMEGARDLALEMQAAGKGRVLDQFGNDDNWRAHFEGTGPEIWRDTDGGITHFVSAMGTTGTITGVSRYLKAQRESVRIIGRGLVDSGHSQMAASLYAGHLSARDGRSDRRGEPGRCRGDGPPAGHRRRDLLWHLGGRRLLHCTAAG